MEKTVVCFANSRKKGERCFAGKSIDDKRWIRPVSERYTQALNDVEECTKNEDCDCIVCNPEIPKLLDILRIELISKDCEKHQTENYTIDDKKWRKVGILNTSEINDYLDKNTGSLWVNGYSSYSRTNDRVPIELLDKINDSLKLIEVNDFQISVVEETYLDGNHKKRVYGKFKYNNEIYIMPVTDSKLEEYFLTKQTGTKHEFAKNLRVILCISLAPEYNGYCYKLIAGVILFKKE